jgi:hypothetical protein
MEHKTDSSEHGAHDSHAPAAPRGKLHKLHKVWQLTKEQIVPVAVGLVSLLVALAAWFEARPLDWEKSRALASVETASTLVPAGKGLNDVVTTVKISNVGGLSIGITDMHVTVDLTGALSAPWEKSTLMMPKGSGMPIGLRPFVIVGAHDSTHATFQFNDSIKSWHIVDPGRSVTITFVQRVHGDGLMAVFVNLYTQPMKLQSEADMLTEPEVVNGIKRPAIPESGTGEISESPVYPYSAGHILVIPK